MARGVKSNFRASRIVSVKHMSSVCALTEDIFQNVNFDKQHPIPASIQCHTKHNDIPKHSGSNTACQAFAISECELTCFVAWP